MGARTQTPFFGKGSQYPSLGKIEQELDEVQMGSRVRTKENDQEQPQQKGCQRQGQIQKGHSYADTSPL